MIKAPIIIDEHGDTSIYESVKDAELDLEAIDVKNKEYVAYDSEGRLLRLIPASVHEVTVESAEQEPNHADELRALLFDFLAYMGAPVSWLEKASLQELVERSLEYKTDMTFHSPIEGIRNFLHRWFSR